MPSWRERQGDRLQMLRMILRTTAGIRGAFAAGRTIARGRTNTGPISTSETIKVPMRELEGGSVFVRPGTTDLGNAVSYYHHGVHLPPEEAGDLKRIVELGTNAGAALTGLAIRHPDAQLLGVEPDPGNFSVAQRNVERFGARCKVVHGRSGPRTRCWPSMNHAARL